MDMVSKPTRTLVDLVGVAGIAWLWLAIYESFTRSGLWRVIADAVGGVPTLACQAAVLGTCLMIGWITIAATAWTLWFLLLRRRPAADFPTARLV